MKSIKKILNYFKIRKLIIILLYCSGIYSLRNLMIREKGIFILFYHRLEKRKPSEVFPFLAVEVDNFIKHIKYLKNNYEVISMDEACNLLSSKSKLEKNYFVVTFDDGYRDNYDYGLEIFKNFDIRPTIYLAANNIENQKFLWVDMVGEIIYSSTLDKVFIDMLGKEFSLKSLKDKTDLLMLVLNKLKEYDNEEKYRKIDLLANILKTGIPSKCELLLSWDNAKELSNNGVDIGSHTMNHPILTKISSEEAALELKNSKELIEKRVGKSVNHFAYPNGRKSDYNQYIKEVAAKYYKTAVTTLFGGNAPGENLHELKRIGLGPGVSLIEFKFLIQKARIKMAKAKR